MYNISFDIRLGSSVPTATFKHLLTVTSVPTSKGSNVMRAMSVCPVVNSNGNVGCYYYTETNMIYLVAGSTISSSSRYVVSGLMIIK